jgi:hypothetical protein
MNKTQAEQIATSALIWLAGEDDLITQFLGMTGASADDLRQKAGDPEFLGAIIDFIMTSDETVLALSAALNIKPDTVVAARAALPGGDLPNWT